MKITFAAAALLAASIGSAQAAPVTYAIDPAHLSVHFIVNHLGYSNLIGRFNAVKGDIAFDRDAIENSKLNVSVDTASIDTNHAKRDDHLRSPDFFNVKEFPQMTFTAGKIEKTGDKTGKLIGDLTLLGVTKPVTLDVTFNKDAANPMSKKDTLGFSARGSFKRTDFGMKYGAPNIGDEVQLLVEAEAVKQ
jgi:polyisoprenoid-binding protein YceI